MVTESTPDVLSPECFWTRYRDAISAKSPTLGLYQDNRSWTELTARAAEATIRNVLGTLYPKGNSIYDPVDYSREYFRIDATGSQRIKDYNWHLRIAYEHENASQRWTQEFCKLTHVIANLRVVIGYDDRYHNEQSGKELIEEAVKVLSGEGDECRISRLEKSHWLIALGPVKKNYRRNRNLPFLPCKIVDKTVKIIKENDAEMLRPGTWSK